MTIQPAAQRPPRPLRMDVVRDGLRRAIAAGEFPPGSKLPNEDRLAIRFAVSRATVREAVRGLVEEGYLVRRQGSGTYVTERPLLSNSLDVNFSYTAYLESLGVRSTRRVLAVRRARAGPEVADRLRIEPDAAVVEVRRVRTADGRPAIYSVDVLPLEVVGAVEDGELGGSLYSLLARVGHPVVHGEAVVAPDQADRTLAAVLEVPEGTLLQHLDQVDVAATGRRVMRSLEWHVPSVIELRCFRRGPGLADVRDGHHGDAAG